MAIRFTLLLFCARSAISSRQLATFRSPGGTMLVAAITQIWQRLVWAVGVGRYFSCERVYTCLFKKTYILKMHTVCCLGAAIAIWSHGTSVLVSIN